MASVVTYGGGLRRIEFSLVPNGPRKLVRLGRVSAKVADSWESRIEAIISDKLAGRAHNAELSEWLGGLDETSLKRLRKVGLADGVGLSHTTLGAFLDGYIAQRTDTKPATQTVYGHTRRCLVEYFGAEKPLASITPGDADAWRTWLTTSEELAENTIRRRTGFAKQFFRVAVRRRLLRENPFGDLRGVTVRANRDKDYFLTRPDAEALLTACPNDEWRLLIALSRYGGLRCPSEHLALRWGDIDWERNRFTVTSPKTERHEGGATRTLPIFPELRIYLDKAFDAAPEGSEFVVTRYRDPKQNLRSQLLKIIKRAGLTAWPRLFHNLRATRQTELAAEFPLHVVCEWIGNSKLIAQEHYLRVTDADFTKAQQKPQYKAQQSPSPTDCQPMTSTPNECEKPPETEGLVTVGHASSTDDKTDQWSLLDSNQ